MFTDIKEGWHYAFINPVVRAVNLGLATGLIGGGMLIPLGQTFSNRSSTPGRGATACSSPLGLGVGGRGVIARVGPPAADPEGAVFPASRLRGRRRAARGAASMSTLFLGRGAVVAVMGVFAGSVYVLGFTLLQENVEDELRGRVFAGVYILVRMCVLLDCRRPVPGRPARRAVRAGLRRRPRIALGGFEINVPGVRLTLWLAGASCSACWACLSCGPSDRRGKDPPEHPNRGRRRQRRIRRRHLRRRRPLRRRSARRERRQRARREAGHRFIAFEGGEAQRQVDPGRRLAAASGPS